MEGSMKYTCFLVLLLILSIVGFNGVHGKRDCGKLFHHQLKHIPFISELTICSSCVLQFGEKRVGLECFCEVMYSKEILFDGVLRPEAVKTIPKRCKAFKNHDATKNQNAYKCGGLLTYY
ncbi:putative lipid-transfer protein DIR1 [Fagus crenata]